MAPPKGMPKGSRIRVIGGTCKRGHTLTEESVYFVGNGRVQCSLCDLQRHRVNSLVNQGIRAHADEYRLSRNVIFKQ